MADFKEEVIVFCGPMWSGKSNSLLLVVDKLKYAGVPYMIFKPDIDEKKESITSRYQNSTEKAISIPKDKPREILKHINVDTIKPPFTVALDEAQFFTDEIYDVVMELNKKGIRVVVSGLDLDAWAKPFGSMPLLLSLATKVVKLISICTTCKAPATKTAYKAHQDAKSNFLVDEGESGFFPQCSCCYHKFMSGK